MSQFILDEQIDAQVVLPSLRRWTSVTTLQDLRPGELVLDDRIPEVLLTLATPTFITIDQGFWNRHLAHPRYCILHFAVPDDQQGSIAPLLRALVKLEQFGSKKARMGKVARIGVNQIEYYEHRVAETKRLTWSPRTRKQRRK